MSNLDKIQKQLELMQSQKDQLATQKQQLLEMRAEREAWVARMKQFDDEYEAKRARRQSKSVLGKLKNLILRSLGLGKNGASISH